MSHGYHEGLEGYSPGQILHQGCGECEARSKEPGGGIAHLDPVRFAYAWRRASIWKAGSGVLVDLDNAERTMLGALWEVQIQLENRGFAIGICPQNYRFTP